MKSLFKSLSEKYPNEYPERLISIKKSPFYQISDNEYCLIDNILALDKCYNQFINDFWFDYINSVKKENGSIAFTIKDYRSIIGYFLENYTEQILLKMIGFTFTLFL